MEAQNQLAVQREKWQEKIDKMKSEIEEAQDIAYQRKILARFQMQQQVELHQHEEMKMQNYIEALQALPFQRPPLLAGTPRCSPIGQRALRSRRMRRFGQC